MPEQQLEPLPYHVELRNYLKSNERELWNWFASARAQADYRDNLRLELLKTTYRLDAEHHPEIYRSVEEAKSKLKLNIPVTLYQAQNNPHINAALYFLPDEGHIVFFGPILTLLAPEEIKSVISHELAHYHLWSNHQGEFHIADRLVQAVASDARAAASHEQTAKRYQLYTEIFADRGSLLVTENVEPVIASLIKMQTGLAQVNAAGYLKQAEEIFAKGRVATEELSHPEAFIRARALELWRAQPADAAEEIAGMIEGSMRLEELDLVGQSRLTNRTRRLLQYFLQPKWLQTPAVLGHAKLFFNDFLPATIRDENQLVEFKFKDPKLRDYVCYLLLDFVTADPELEEMPLAAALDFCGRLELDTAFEKLAAKELKLKIREVRRIKEQAAEMLAKAEVNGE